MLTPAFHEGERLLQARAGMAERMADIGPRVIRPAMPDPHRELFEKLPFMLLGALDAQRRPWATVLVGAPGFVRTPDAQKLWLGALPLTSGVLPLSLAPGAPVGLLGIEPATRRRNRVNGVIDEASHDGLQVAVRQSFGNCPKYIHVREFDRAPAAGAQPALAFGAELPAEAAVLVERADTFFIATASPDAGLPQQTAQDGVDVSHRGGERGFVRRERNAEGDVLSAADYPGNFFFNTLGNITVNPRAGLLFIDWLRGDVLALTGAAEVVWTAPQARELRVQVQAGHWLPGAMPLREHAAL